MIDSIFGAKICKVSLEHFVLPENKRNYQKSTGVISEGLRSLPEEAPTGPKLGINKNSNTMD